MKDAHYHSSSLSPGFCFGIAQLARFGEFGDMPDHLSPASTRPDALGTGVCDQAGLPAHLRRTPRLQRAFLLAFNLLDGACSPPFLR